MEKYLWNINLGSPLNYLLNPSYMQGYFPTGSDKVKAQEGQNLLMIQNLDTMDGLRQFETGFKTLSYTYIDDLSFSDRFCKNLSFHIYFYYCFPLGMMRSHASFYKSFRGALTNRSNLIGPTQMLFIDKY